MNRLLQRLLSFYFRTGTVRVTTASGHAFTCGDGSGEPIAIRFTTARAQWACVFDPELKLGEAYMDGELVMERGSIADLLAIGMRQNATVIPTWVRPLWALRLLARPIQQFNRRRQSRRNVAHHYDLDGRLYSLFLDADRQYSCAYFEYPGQSLDDAQLAKKRHLAAKLRLASGQNVLDIGCGWGGLGLYLAEMADVSVTGVTLSEEQHRIANARAAESGLSGKAQFRLIDYRDVPETFDRIVSVGMFEHVGARFYNQFFEKSAALLKDDGAMVLHFISRSEGPGYTNPWIAKYIFPGGYIPAPSEVLPAIERAGLLVTDIEFLRLHYAETLKAWRTRFLAHREEITRIYDERFVRMWEFYLAASEMAFREQNMMVMQIQLTKRQDVIPITRDYIAQEEARLRRFEGERVPPIRLAGE
ncbi:MAG: class I SAM-dependent methyltransferase [Pseudolabrys sp.]|nr:class I SAM-dependent methyltransferase [Pseudolabrys sp.]